MSDVLKKCIQKGERKYTLLHVVEPKHAAGMLIEFSKFNIDSSWSEKSLVSEYESEVKLPEYIQHCFKNRSNLELVGMVNLSEELMLTSLEQLFVSKFRPKKTYAVYNTINRN